MNAGKEYQIGIPLPCHENWDAMAANEKGRFCNSCSKSVIDFSNYSSAEILQYLQNSKQDVCGRVKQEQLSTNTNLLPKKKLHYFLYAVLVVFILNLPTESHAQHIQP